MQLKPIGVIHSPYKKKGEAPRQGRYSDKLSKITIFNDYEDAMDGMSSNKYYFIFYWLDQAERDLLKGIPPGKTEERGVFSIRSPIRPNPIGMCLVELVELEGNELTVKWLDALEGSPLLDIKPFWPETDCVEI